MLTKKSNPIKTSAQLKPRSIKIQPHFRFPEYQKYNLKPTRIIPKILLCGNWLEKAGFKTGQRIKVTCSKNNL
jgi:hypothetical protein